MRIAAFRIRNFKSIVDSGWCNTDSSGLMMLVGQNESGKTTTLEALNFFGNGKGKNYDQFVRLEGGEEMKPLSVEVAMKLEKDDVDSLSSSYPLPVKFFEDLLGEEVHFIRSNDPDAACELGIEENFAARLWSTFLKGYKNAKVYEKSDKELSESSEIPSQPDDAAIESMAEEMWGDFVNDLCKMLPTFSLYDSFQDILPDQIVLSEISKHNAVKDFIAVYGVKFDEIAAMQVGRRTGRLDSINEFHTKHIGERWRQKLFDGHQYRFKSSVDPQDADLKSSRISFLIDNGDGNWLHPRQRSAGFRWFSALDLRLQALHHEKGDNFVLLIDEPSQFLHESAQKDLREILKELANEGFQIFVTTHSPHLLDMNAPQEIRIVSQEKDKGTLMETMSQYVSCGRHAGNTSDPLSPIRTSMGLTTVDPLLRQGKLHVIVEGISDKYYLQAFTKLLGKEEVFFFPSGGAPKVPTMYSVLTGWGIPSKVICDGDNAGKAAKGDLVKHYFFGDEELAKKTIYIHKAKAIEELFSVADFAKIVLQNSSQPAASVSELLANLTTSKELAAASFYNRCADGSVATSNLSQETINNFEEVFSWLFSKDESDKA